MPSIVTTIKDIESPSWMNSALAERFRSQDDIYFMSPDDVYEQLTDYIDCEPDLDDKQVQTMYAARDKVVESIRENTGSGDMPAMILL